MKPIDAEVPESRAEVPESRADVRRRNVLVVTHLFPGHAREIRGPWVAEQVDALRRIVDIEVLCCSPTVDDRFETRPSGVPVEYRSIRTILGNGHAGLLGSSIRYDRALGRRLGRGPRPDILHAHFGIPDAIVAQRHAAKRRIPFVVTLHGDDAFKVLRRRDPIGGALRRAVRGASTVICVSRAMADAVREAMPGTEPEVIPNGYDDAVFHVGDGPRDLGLLFVGMLVPVKNLDILIRAFAAAPDPGVPDLTIVGDGPLRPSLEALAAELGVESRVHFSGARDRGEVAALMRRATALTLPSRSEGWPLVVAEALACGTPVVASRVGGIPEIMPTAASGLLVPPNDRASLTDALVAVSGSRYDPEAVARSSRARPWRVQAEAIAAIYERST